MRPGSRMGTSAGMGLPPTTSGGNRPQSGMRLRTGVPASGPGTQAAQGYAINASVLLSERPMTGQGVMGMKAQGYAGGRIVYDTAYYVGLLRKKISDVGSEKNKLQTEIDQQSKDNFQYSKLEKKYEDLVKNKELLEGQLADYNLALDKTRTSTDPEDVQHMAVSMAEKNRQTGQELDRILAQRKQREQETSQIEDQIEGVYRNIQKRINELDPGRLRAYNELMQRQREYQERSMQSENRLNEINAKIRQYESDEKTNTLRKEYLIQEKKCQSLKKDMESLQEELDIASLEPKEAQAKFANRVNAFKKQTTTLEQRAEQLKDEIANSRKSLDEMDTVTEEDSGEAAKYELLVKRDQDMTAFMDSFEEQRDGILHEQQTIQFNIVALLEYISKGLDDTQDLPSKEALGEMKSAQTFKEKNLATAERTRDSLLAEKKKREKELDLLRSSEPKLMSELSALRENMSKMRSEMQDFQDLDKLRREFDETHSRLTEYKHTYVKRRDSMRQQIQIVSVEYEGLKKSLNTNEYAREIDDMEKRLKHYERTIFELKEFVDTKSRETDYEQLKTACLKMCDTLNALALKNIQRDMGAKGSW